MDDQIRERKLVQWVIAYAAAAFILMQGLELVKEAFEGFLVVYQTVLVLCLMGLPVTVVIAWFHGEKGRQDVPLLEVALLALIVGVTVVLTYQFDVYGPSTTAALPEPPVSRLDTTRYAVLPFQRDPEVPETLSETLRLHDALARWQGIRLVDHVVLRDAVRVDRRDPGEERRVAAAAGAGRYVTGSVILTGGLARIRARLFDTRRGDLLSEAVARAPAGGPLSDSTAERLASTLLFGDLAPEPAAPADASGPVTASYPAMRAFLRGLEARDRWDLQTADSLLARATETAPGHARALYWRAQIQTWAGSRPEEVTGLVESAVAVRSRLLPREERLATGLLHLARGEYGRACAIYDSIRQVDHRSFAAWFGAGECRALDPVVIQDDRSPSGWAFRSSYHRATQAYRRAFELQPLIYRGVNSRTFEQLGERLRVSAGDVLRGHTTADEPGLMLGRTAWLGDTLAMIPYPAADVYAGRPATRPPTHATAVERQRRTYYRIAEHWVSVLPEDPRALEALAHARELLADPRALETLDAALAVTDDPAHRRHLAMERVALLIKFGAPDGVAAARALADSVLDGGPLTGGDVGQLAVVAALAGRAHTAARLAGRRAESQSWSVHIPAAANRPARILTAYTALGGPADSVAAYERQVEAAILNRIPPEDRDAARLLLLQRAASLAYMALPLECFHRLAGQANYPVLLAQSAHARGDDAEALRLLAGIRDGRLARQMRPAEVTFDALLPEARLWTELGDTLTAIVMLDGSLNTLRWSEPGLLADVPRAAALVRSMALRAELAAATADGTTARRWARAVVDLWGGADPALKPVTDRIRRILEAPPPGSTPLPAYLSPQGGL